MGALRTPLVERLQSALASLGPVSYRSTLLDVLAETGADTMGGECVHAIAAAVDQADRLTAPTADVATKHWLDAIALIKHRWNAPGHNLSERAWSRPLAPTGFSAH